MKATILVAALLVSPAADDPLAKACQGTVCVIPKDYMRSLIDAHNAHVDEIAELNRLLRAADTRCRIERNV